MSERMPDEKSEIKEKGKYIEIPKNVTQREWIFSDFDRDGVKNVDDRYPLNPNRKALGPLHSHKAELSTPEARLSTEILAIERFSNDRSKMLKTFLRKHPNSYGRVKAVPSTMKKLRERYINRIGDVAGATVETHKRKDVNEKVAKLKKEYPNVKQREDNYYRKMHRSEKGKGKVYYAHHITVRPEKKKMLEIEVKTHKMRLLHDRMHSAYKDKENFKMLYPVFKKEAKRLFKMGY